MKRILYIISLSLVMITAISCSDDFLSKNNGDLYLLSDTLFLSNNQEDIITSVQLPVSLNSDFTIFMQPKWLSFNSMHGEVINGAIPLSFKIVKENLPSWYPQPYQIYYAMLMVDITNLGLVSLNVAYMDFGSPTIQCSVASLDFESSGSQNFTISNVSQGVLNWYITGIPEWLVLSPSKGILDYGNSITISAFLNQDKIIPGEELNGNIQIISNSTSGNYSLNVRVPANAILPEQVASINGIVTDAEYNHETGIMAVCTKSPNSLIIYNTTSNDIKTISFSNIPSCVSLSADGHQAAVGFATQSLCLIGIDDLEITDEFDIDCEPYDIVLGDNGWCYITPTADQWVYFRNLNLNTGTLTLGKNNYMVYEKTIIRKVPGKSSIVGSRMGLSPTGILIFDITKGIASDTISYYHESIGNFWISGDASRLYCGSETVYDLPDYDTEYHVSPPPVTGQISSELNVIAALDECPAIKSVFVTSSYYYFQSGYTSLIEQFNTVNLNKVRSYNVSPVIITENGVSTPYETSPRFLFVNKEGSTLYAIKNLKENYNKDYWTIEAFNLVDLKK